MSNVQAWGSSSAIGPLLGVRVVVLSNALRLLFPPLLFSSLPKRAIGFSYPSGREGKVIGVALLAATGVVSLLLMTTVGVAGIALAVWLMGGTAGLIIYNSTREKIAFVKEHCQSCRLRPLIEEHEAMHLHGEPSEDVVWGETMRRYSYKSLGLSSDPGICSFCPIAKKLRDHS
ncbi:MAG: hypothetical protein OK456_04065 [Thaumarchaeota archaeon]|nr:hypothetical protein [Nitrososphaerota archaeon]